VKTSGEWKKYSLAESDNDELLEAIDDYEAQMAALEKGEATRERLTEDYYTLAEVRLAADIRIAEYGSLNQRLTTIAETIDRKRPELKPVALEKGGG